MFGNSTSRTALKPPGASGGQRLSLTVTALRPALRPWLSNAWAPTRYVPSSTPPPAGAQGAPPVDAPIVHCHVKLVPPVPLVVAPCRVPLRYQSAELAAWSVVALKLIALVAVVTTGWSGGFMSGSVVTATIAAPLLVLLRSARCVTVWVPP